jgi:hypothetical protein
MKLNAAVKDRVAAGTINFGFTPGPGPGTNFGFTPGPGSGTNFGFTPGPGSGIHFP